ncbi:MULTISPECIES: hypothetical protein [unclassified Staphylococcus]|uniref:hypothetical protein n=1 Tax=Staphylococcus TaxID=1279 RepID=UPI00086A65BE|nr:MULTISPECIES: hypothetical protein [unclassified Staphylococcus]SCS91189.1 Uncharacterised protein [Staphylococcus cohnii subsp. cohnii]
MSDDDFLDTYKERMSEEETIAVDELYKGSAYKKYLRRQVEVNEVGDANLLKFQ